MTTALPSLSSTFEISPTWTPAMLTVWPWPGVTAWAVESSALTTKKSLPISGTQAGSVSRCLPRMKTATAPAITIRPMIATKSSQCLRIAILMAWPHPPRRRPSAR